MGAQGDHLIPEIDRRYSPHLFYVRSYPPQHAFQKSRTDSPFYW